METIIISGAGKGLGKGLAMYFAMKGYNVAIASRTKADLDEISETVAKGKFAGKLFTAVADLSQKSEVEKFCEEVKNQFPEIKVLINNLGIYQQDNIENFEEEVLDRNLNTNLKSAVWLTKNLVQPIIKTKGNIINICSVITKRPRKEGFSYTISKAALKGFNDSIREDLREKEVKVSAIYPAAINTSSWEGTDEETLQQLIQPDDIVRAIETILSANDATLFSEIHIDNLRSI